MDVLNAVVTFVSKLFTTYFYVCGVVFVLVVLWILYGEVFSKLNKNKVDKNAE